MDILLKPRIRFKGFTDVWEQRKLGEIGNTFTGLSGKTKEDFGHGEAKFVTYMNVFSNPIAQLNKTEPIEIDNKQNQVEYGDVFFTTSSETPDEVGMSSVWLENKGNIYLNSFCFGFRPFIKNDPFYMAYMLRANKFRKSMTLLAQGISRYNISKAGVMNIDIQLPNNQEQERIGKFFYEIDNLITLHQRKCDKLVELKNSLLEKMFPKNSSNIPEIRFKGFTDVWEQRKLGYYVLDLKSGLSRMLSEYDIGLPVLRANNINDCKLEMTHDVKYWYLNDPQGANTSNYFIAKDDILINFINSEAKMGTAAIVENTPNRPTIFTTNILRMKLNDKANSYFYLAQSMTSKYKNYIKGISKIAVNQASFTTVDFKNYDYTAPKIDEQVKIGELFHNLDNLITLHQRKHEKLVNLKQSLLNDMFI